MKKNFPSVIVVAALCFFAACKKSDFAGLNTKPALKTNTTSMTFATLGESQILYVTGNSDSVRWTLDASDTSWLTISAVKSGKGNNTTPITLKALGNTSLTEGRSVVLTLSGTGVSPITINVSQSSDPEANVANTSGVNGLTDTYFRNACLTVCGTDGVITVSKAATVDSMNFSTNAYRSYIVNTNGLEFFTGLKYFNCSGFASKSFTTLDISKNISLTGLNCSGATYLKTIYVWPGFDIANPPVTFIKPATATYVIKP